MLVLQIKSAPWFHGMITRTKAEDILNSKKTLGSFLVRAGLEKGEFYVSVSGGRKIRHVTVHRLDNSFVAICGPNADAMRFSTFYELLDYLRSTPIRFDDDGTYLLLKDFVKFDDHKD